MNVKFLFLFKVIQSMKYLLIVVSFSIFCFYSLACSTFTHEKATIHGQIIGSSDNFVAYTKPVNDLYYWGFADTVEIDSTGNFYIRLDITNPAFVEIRINKKNILLIVEPGERIELTYDFTKNPVFSDLKSKNKLGLFLLDELPNPPSLRMVGSTRFLDTLSIEKVNMEIGNRLQKELSEFYQLNTEKYISTEFLGFVKDDRECYYEALKATYYRRKFMKTNPEDLDSFPQELKASWINIFENNPITKKNFFHSRWWYDYAQNFLNNKEYLNEEFRVEKLNEMYNNGTIHSHNLNIAQKFLDGEMLEFYSARYLEDAAYQKDYEKELLTLFEKFTLTYPDSPYSDYISPHIQPIADFHKVQDEAFNIDLLQNSDSLNTLSGCIKLFKGKPLFIDVWASWCGPCKEEFKYKSQLDKLLQDNGFELLYISIDDDRRKESWIQMIKGYKLNGKHVRANKKLNSDLRKIYDQNGSITIPWYIIVNANGEIEIEHAYRPSQTADLEKQLQSVRIIH